MNGNGGFDHTVFLEFSLYVVTDNCIAGNERGRIFLNGIAFTTDFKSNFKRIGNKYDSYKPDANIGCDRV